MAGKIQEANLSMAKRQRGSTRPGQRPPTKSPSGRPSAALSPAPVRPRPATTLTEDELAHAAEISTLAIVAADEYTYVQRDLRRIAVVFVGIFAILFIAFILATVTGIARTV